jgi:hypothetical protein
VVKVINAALVCACVLKVGNHPQIVGDHAPADPALHPIIAMVATAVESMQPFEPADAASLREHQSNRLPGRFPPLISQLCLPRHSHQSRPLCQ